MTDKCVRCNEEEPKVECSDCLSSKRKGEVASLCDACSELIHVGFLAEHDVQPIAVKLKKQEFKSQLEVYKKYDQQLKFKQTEMGYAKNDIDTRVGVTQRAIHEALGKVFNAMKEKETELVAIVKESVAQKKAALADCETKITETMTQYNEVMKETDTVLKAEQSEFMEKCEEVQTKITDSSILKIQSSFPSLGSLPTIDITHLLTSVQQVQLSNDDEGVDISMPDTPKTVEEGDNLKVYMESRMDAKGCFWVSRDMDPELNSILDNISYQMREDIVLNPMEKVEVTEGMLCCGQYQQDHRWYRAKVEQVKNNQVGGACLFLRDRQWGRAVVEQVKPGQNKAHVRWLDYAHENEVPVSCLYPLKEEFKTIPFQALRCCIFEEYLETEIPRPARWEFSDLTNNAALECTILKVLADKQIYIVELKNPEKPNIDIKQRLESKVSDGKTKKDSIQCHDIRYMKDYTPPPASEIRAKQKQEREKRGGKRGGKDKRASKDEKADESESGKSGRSTPDGQGDKKPDAASPGQQNNSVSSTSGGDGKGGSGGKKAEDGSSVDPSPKQNDDKPTTGKGEAKEEGEKPNSIITTDKMNIKGPIDESKVFVPISGQSEKVPITSSVGGIVNLSSKQREAMAQQTYITPSTGGSGGVAVTAIVSTPPRTTAPESAEEEEERQLTERLAQKGDHVMAHSPDSASSNLLPEVAQLFNSHSQGQTVPGQGGVPLPGQMMQGGYSGGYPAGYNYNMGPMQSQQGYYAWGVPQGHPGRVPMGSQGMPLQQPIHSGDLEQMHGGKPYHASELSTRSPPPPYSREVEQAIPDSTTDWDENSWNQPPPARHSAGPGRMGQDMSEDSYQGDESQGDYRESDDVRSDDVRRSQGPSPMTDHQRRPNSYRDRNRQGSHQRGGYGACYRCGGQGHIARDCHLPPTPGQGQGNRRHGDRRGGGGYRKGNQGRKR